MEPKKDEDPEEQTVEDAPVNARALALRFKMYLYMGYLYMGAVIT